MLRKFCLVLATAALAMAFTGSTATAAPEDRAPIPPPTDYWQDMGFILMAHQGGEWDFPPNTLFAYKSAMAIGADMLDMDAYVTADGHIVLTHDLDASDNSNLEPGTFGGRTDINELTLAELKTLDFAYKWRPRGADSSLDPPYRGIATGAVDPPAGFTANDFKIPTFDEVLDAFPDTPINIELKQVGALTPEDIEATAEKMADILAAHPGHDENVIINSFGQEMLDAMHAARPEHKSFSGSQSALLGYITGSPITPTPVALEPPDYYKLGANWVRTVPILKPWAVHDGYKIFVWGSDHDPMQDTPEFYAQLIAEGADSYNTPSPTALAAYLCTAGIAAPDGSPRCAEQVCPEGQTGIAPNNCVDINCPVGQTGTPPNCVTPPVTTCPEGQTGTPPNCVTPPVATCAEGQGGTPPDCKALVDFRNVSVKPLKKVVKAGKKAKIRIRLTNKGIGTGVAKVTVRSSNRKVTRPLSFNITVPAGKTKEKVFKINVVPGPKVKVKIASGDSSVTSTIRMKKSKTYTVRDKDVKLTASQSSQDL